MTLHRHSGRGFVSENEDGDSVSPIHGTAIAAGDITKGHLTRERKLWTADVLREAADTLTGKQIVVNHENKDVYSVIGEVTEATYSDDRDAVIYQGLIDDDVVSGRIGRGWLDVSPRILHTPDMEERGNVKIPQNIREFDNLSVVTKGASKSNSADIGEHEELAIAELRESFDTDLEEVIAEYQEVELQESIDISAYLYDNANAARGAGEDLGCEGTHTKEIEGDKWFLPCETHDSFLRNLAQKRGGEEEMSEIENLSESNGCSCGGPDKIDWDELSDDTLESYAESLGFDDVSQVDDLTEDQKGEIAELATHTDEKRRLAGQMSSLLTLTREEAIDVLNAFDPDAPDDARALSIAIARAHDDVEEEVLQEAFDLLGISDGREGDGMVIQLSELEEKAKEIVEMDGFDDLDVDDVVSSLEELSASEENSAENDEVDDVQTSRSEYLAGMFGLRK